MNSINIFKHGKYQGLACILLNRKDLSVDEVKFFDTFNKKITSTHINEDFINYSYDEEGNVIKTTSKKEISKDNILSASQEFEKFLKNTKMSQLLIIVSCWMGKIFHISCCRNIG